MGVTRGSGRSSLATDLPRRRRPAAPTLGLSSPAEGRHAGARAPAPQVRVNRIGLRQDMGWPTRLRGIGSVCTMRWVAHAESQDILRWSHTVGVLGIKPESRQDEAAFWIPDYLASVGYRIYPVPTHFPHVRTILNQRTYENLSAIPVKLDIVSVFQREHDVPFHVDDLLDAAPSVVWFQSGCVHLASAERLWSSGIRVVGTCIGCTRATISPTQSPLEGQAV